MLSGCADYPLCAIVFLTNWWCICQTSASFEALQFKGPERLAFYKQDSGVLPASTLSGSILNAESGNADLFQGFA